MRCPLGIAWLYGFLNLKNGITDLTLIMNIIDSVVDIFHVRNNQSRRNFSPLYL